MEYHRNAAGKAENCRQAIEEEGEAHYGAHTAAFARHAGSDQAMENAIRFIQGFALTAAELLTDPQHLAAIRRKFEEIPQIRFSENLKGGDIAYSSTDF